MRFDINFLSILYVSLTAGALWAGNPEIDNAIRLWEAGKHTEAVAIFQKYEKDNDADSLAYLGRSYMQGKGVPTDLEKSAVYFQKAAELKQPLALNGLGVCYREGIGVKRDLKKAEELFLQAREKGNQLAAFNLGELYFCYKTEQEREKALKYYQEAFEAGVAKERAGIMIGDLLCGFGKFQEALPYLQYAVQNLQDATPKTLALFHLAIIYENGFAGEQDLNKAIEFAQKAAELGGERITIYGDICYHIGFELFFWGKNQEALPFLKKAADKGDRKAQYLVAILDTTDNRYEYLLAAARQGDRRAYLSAGNYLAGIKKEYAEAMKFYQEAAKDGNPAAMCEIAIMHRLGEGVEADYDKSMEWYQKAADQYFPRALREIAVKNKIIYAKESENNHFGGFSPRLTYCYALYAMATFLGDEVASTHLPELPFYGEVMKRPPADSNMELAVGLLHLINKSADALQNGLELLKLAASHGNVHAMNCLGMIYVQGYQISEDQQIAPDLQLALNYYKMAADKGNSFAQAPVCHPYFHSLLSKDELEKRLIQSARQENQEAIYNLAAFYEKYGDLKKAGEIYLKHARAGNPASQTRIFDMYLVGKIDVPPEEAFNLLNAAVAQHYGDAEAMMADWHLFSSDNGGKGWPRMAAVQLMEAISDGCSDNFAYTKLGDLYFAGHGVKADWRLGEKLYTIAIERGDYGACFMLGSYYQDGKYMPKDLKKARAMFELGSQHGDKYCRMALGWMDKEKAADSAPAEMNNPSDAEK